jgi:uncharacterized short protein YbdD (DUF466 family)
MGAGGGEPVTRRGVGEASVSFGGGPPRRAAARWRGRLAALARVLHRVLGAPDYDAYLAHHARTHPGTAPTPRDEFVRRRQEERYARPGSRCC